MFSVTFTCSPINSRASLIQLINSTFIPSSIGGYKPKLFEDFYFGLEDFYSHGLFLLTVSTSIDYVLDILTFNQLIECKTSTRFVCIFTIFHKSNVSFVYNKSMIATFIIVKFSCPFVAQTHHRVPLHQCYKSEWDLETFLRGPGMHDCTKRQECIYLLDIRIGLRAL